MFTKEFYNKIKDLANSYSTKLHKKVSSRVEEMESDDFSHYLIYRVLGVSPKEGSKIDIYQNKGRFLYKYAGSFLEEAAIMCYQEFDSNAQKKVRIQNTLGTRPKTFEIDCLYNNKAIEIKWRDATTDGDHITKEHTRVKVIKEKGYIPVRIMFYYPNRIQAIKIQETLQTLYKGVDGYYYFGDDAWNYIRDETKIDLYEILKKIADENDKELEN